MFKVLSNIVFSHIFLAINVEISVSSGSDIFITFMSSFVSVFLLKI